MINPSNLDKLPDPEGEMEFDQEHIYSSERAYELQEWYFCSICWHRVQATPIRVEGRQWGTSFKVTCTNPNCQCCNGPTNFVTQGYVNWRKAESHIDAYHAREALAVIRPRQSRRSTDAVIKELGF